MEFDRQPVTAWPLASPALLLQRLLSAVVLLLLLPLLLKTVCAHLTDVGVAL
jgi:hypothetical protein